MTKSRFGLDRSVDPAWRFWVKVLPVESGCWEWQAKLNSGGYGTFQPGRGRPVRIGLAHRFSYVLHHGAIPDGLYVCHHCDNRRCVRPEHLFVGTNLENALDCKAKGRISRRQCDKTHCPSGHEYSPENTYRTPTDGARQCRLCAKLRYRQRKSDEGTPPRAA